MDVKLEGKEGDLLAVTSPSAPDAPTLPAGLPPAHARDGETRGRCWERLRKEGRAAGMARLEAYQYATREADRLFPVIPPPPPDPEPPAAVEPEPPAPDPPPVQVEPPAAPETPSAATGSGLAGIGDLPAEWPELPANASLAVEVAWVQANRLRVRCNGDGVDLARALSPAPSHAALSWLETSILFPAKWADVTVKASADQQTDSEDARREKIALGEVRSLLAEATASE